MTINQVFEVIIQEICLYLLADNILKGFGKSLLTAMTLIDLLKTILVRAYDPRQLENIGKISNLGGGIAQRPETRPRQQQLKNTQNRL